ncbi:hypothetical protein BRADI_3g29465v3 [Brachypodium distachyon]|uniref:Ubiquitin-like protease family profile domain-containing protein n=1 Tax=Brachypodium distachyon TaxID=15368 RepID=A0A0Q3LY69_BRADI|nr:hypothetical protein BRADI_3g29465v3 [Brachypodium distachyon]
MNTIEDEEEAETGNLVHRRRRSKSVRQDQGQDGQLQATAISIAENVLQVGRNRASLARLYKLNQELSPKQIDLIKSKDFGGLLNIAKKLPSEMNKWLMSTYTVQSRQMIIPERGSIAVTADSVHRNFKLPNRGKKVIYKKTQESVDFITKEYGLEREKSPEITDWCKMIKGMNGKADDKFLGPWLIAAMSCLLCPTTSLHVSPRCYPNFINLDEVMNTNFCEFVVDQIHEACSKPGDKNSAKCCVYHLLILYLDSLDITENVRNCPMCAEAWTTELIDKVVQQDMKEDGGYGKLNKKRKIAIMLGELCIDISHKLGKFVECIGQLHDEDVKESNEEAPKKRRQRNPPTAKVVKKKRGYALDAAEEDVDEEKEQGEDNEGRGLGDNHCEADKGDDGDAGQGESSKEISTPIVVDQLSKAEQLSDAKMGVECKGDKNVREPEAKAEATLPKNSDITKRTARDASAIALKVARKYKKIVFRRNSTLRTVDSVAKAKEENRKEIGNVRKEASTCASQGTEIKVEGSTKQCTQGKATNVTELAAATAQLAIHTSHPHNSAKSVPIEHLQGNDKPMQPICKSTFRHTFESMDFACPSFDLALDSQPVLSPNSAGPHVKLEETSVGNTCLNVANDPPTISDDDWDDAMIAEARKLADQIELKRVTGSVAKDERQAIIDLSTPLEGKGVLGVNNFSLASSRSAATIKPKSASTIIDLCTPPPPARSIHGKENNDDPSAISSFGSAPQQGPVRRFIKQPACKRPPLVDIESKGTYYCSSDVKDAYATVLAKGNRSTVGKKLDASPQIINFSKYFITLNELASSMAPRCRLNNDVVEIGIEYIMQKQPSSVKKFVMPLRIAISNFPDFSNHYWLFNLNIRDRRYEIFDSLRSFSNKSLNDCAKTILACITCLWDSYYPKSKVKVNQFNWYDVEGPKQDNGHDCGIFMLVNADLWHERHPLDYAQSKIPNIRKLLTHDWLNSEENKLDWKTVLKI